MEQSLRQWMAEDAVVFKMFLTHDTGEQKIALSNGTEESFDFMDDTSVNIVERARQVRQKHPCIDP